MTGSPLLDLFIAMAMFYFALCMVCSSANDAVARVLNWRAAMLFGGVRSLLLNATVKRIPPGYPNTTAPATFELADLFFNHPFIQTLRWQANIGDTWLSRRLDGTGEWLTGVWRAATGGDASPPDPAYPQLDPRTKLTAIPSAVFAHTLTEILKPDGGNPNDPPTFASLWRAIDSLDDQTAGPLKVVLKSIANDANQDLEVAKAKIAKWFDEGMNQATVWFRHRMRTASIIVGAVLCFALNIDSIEVANRFYKDTNLRNIFVGEAIKETNRPKPAMQPGDGTKPVEPLTKAADSDDTKRSQATDTKELLSGLKFGWQTKDPQDILNELQKGMKLLGLLITVAAISMGAPFWHDVVTKLVVRRKNTDPPDPTRA